MSYILKGLMNIVRVFSKAKVGWPTGIGGLYVLISFAYDLITGKGVPYAVSHLAQKIFAAELTINKGVHLALQKSVEYNLGTFIDMIFSILMLYILVKWIALLMTRSFGANENFGAYIWAIIIIFILEIAAVAVIDGKFGFIPIRDGIWFLIKNIGPVLTHMHWFWQNNV